MGHRVRQLYREPVRAEKPEDLIYTIAAASEMLGVHPRTLLMLEHLGRVRPARTATGRRRYSRLMLNDLKRDIPSANPDDPRG